VWSEGSAFTIVTEGSTRGGAVAFQFKRANCVAVGTFNMYIIQPAWLAKVGILPKDVQVAIQSRLDEPGFRFSSLKLHWRWVVTPNLIQIETDRPEVDCGEVLARVFDKLPWTPLIALGNNAVYQAPLRDIESIPLALSLRRETPEGFPCVQRTLHYGLKHEDTLFNVQLAATEDELELVVNAHTELLGHESEDAQKAARRFFEDRHTGERLTKDLFPGSVIDDNPNI
jgi:hypothetical protein